MEIEILTKIILSALLGMLIGLERTVAGKHAGMRTFALVSVGSTLFVIVSVIVTNQYIGITGFDPMRIPAAIISGIGFIGAGMILMSKDTLKGLTTAAGLWVASGIGVAVGFGMYYLATFTSLIVLIIFMGAWYFEDAVRRYFNSNTPVTVEPLHKKGVAKKNIK